MLINQPKTGSELPSETMNDNIFDVDTNEFEMKVLGASMEGPVIVDFWAPWCAPCKQLMPMLEGAVSKAAGKVKLAKVNIDSNPELSQALRVQSVPTVYAFYQGQPVDGFTGVVTPGELDAFIEKLSMINDQGGADQIDVSNALTLAAQALSEGDLASAQGVYLQVLSQDENNIDAYSGLIRVLIAAGEVLKAKQMAESAPQSIKSNEKFASIQTAIKLADSKPEGDLSGLQAQLEGDENNHSARFEIAMDLFSSGQQEAAIDHLIEIVKRDKEWEEEKARKQLLEYFEALGPSDPLTVSGRRKLSTVLFS
jgi:putative thioredoxin